MIQMIHPQITQINADKIKKIKYQNKSLSSTW